MPSPSAPSRPASRSTARSTDTVLCVLASSTIGCTRGAGQLPGLAPPARDPAAASGFQPNGPRASAAYPLLSPAGPRTAPDAGLGPDQVQRQLRMTRDIPVADQHGHVGGHALGPERGRGERGGHREEDHRAALGGGQHRAALAAGHVHADHGDVGRAAGRLDRGGQRDRVPGVRDHHLVGQPGARAPRPPPARRHHPDDAAGARPGGRPPRTATRSCPPAPRIATSGALA